MTLWFHRSVLKGTTLVNFSDVLSGSFNINKLASDLQRVRDRLLEYLPDPSHTTETIKIAFVAYMSLMSGFFMDFKLSGKKVRYSFVFKWTQSLLGQRPHVQQDAAFDIANMCVNVALWYMKHASFTASKKTISIDDANDIHTSLKNAAGLFHIVLKELLPLLELGIQGSDLDPRVLNAYYNQCIAEAQEVTIARAIELQHNDLVISALAHDTSRRFETSKSYISGLDNTISEQWIFYLDIKKYIYLAYAYCYSGKMLSKENHYGAAIRSFKESNSMFNKSIGLCKLYSRVKGPAKPVRPDGHPFFLTINNTFSSLLEKYEADNEIMYQQVVPDSPTPLENKAAYGKASHETYTLPSPSPVWEYAFENKEQVPATVITLIS